MNATTLPGPRLRAAVLAAALAAGAAAPGVAAPRARVTVVAPGATVDTFSVSGDTARRGAAVAAWTTDDPQRVRVAVRVAQGARFSRTRVLGAGRVSRVAMSPNGRRAVVTWLKDGTAHAASMEPGGRWRRETLPDLPRDGGVDVSALAVTDDGTVTAAVEQRTPTFWRAFVLRGSAGTWNVAAALAASDVGGGSVSVTPTGAVTAAWLAPSDDGPLRLLTADLAPDAVEWSGSRELARDEGLVQPFADAADPSVRLVVSGRENDSGPRFDARAFVTTPDREWAALPVSARAAVAAVPDGTAWSAESDGWRVIARRLPAGAGAWSSPEAIALAPAQVIAGPGLVRVGSTVAAWWVVDGGRGRADRWYASVRGSRGWTAAVPVATTSGLVAFAGAADGRLIAVYVTGARPGSVVVRDVAGRAPRPARARRR